MGKPGHIGAFSGTEHTRAYLNNRATLVAALSSRCMQDFRAAYITGHTRAYWIAVKARTSIPGTPRAYLSIQYRTKDLEQTRAYWTHVPHDCG